MNKRGSLKTAVLSLIFAALFLTLSAPHDAGVDARAQNPPRGEEISEELAALVRNKWDAITLEACGPAGGVWAGNYRAFGGPTVTTRLAWTPASGFAVWWENCSRPWTARVNYGSAVFDGGSLKLTPALPENSPSSYMPAPEYVPVEWGEQHFLIPSDELINFAYAAHSTSVEEVESFLMKTEDYEKDRKGLPNLPPEYRKYLVMKPLRAKVSGFGPVENNWYPRLVLDAGRAEGVVPGMKFYLARPGKIRMRLEVADVREHSSEARVVMAGREGDGEQEIEPKVGWKFTSRAPKDDWGP